MQPVYLTFDDGPDPRYTPQVLDVLQGLQMQATFFMVGQQARRFPALVRQVAAQGHVIGNHTYSHRHPWSMLPARARAEVSDGAAVLREILGEDVRFYRPPHGRYRRCMNRQAQECGQRPVLWNVSAVDWGPMGTAQNIARRLHGITAGSVVLMHDGRNRHNRPDQLLQVLPGLLAHWREQGLHSFGLGRRAHG